MHPIKAWVNQPSSLQEDHKHHGKRVFVIGTSIGPNKYDIPGYYEGSEYIHAYLPDTLECMLLHYQSLQIGLWI